MWLFILASLAQSLPRQGKDKSMTREEDPLGPFRGFKNSMLILAVIALAIYCLVLAFRIIVG